MITVAAAIITSKNKILIAKRGATKSLPNLWEFPGGKVEENETPEDCVIREIREELNIDIKVIKHFETNEHTYDFGTIRLIAFLAEFQSGKITLNEHAEYKWVYVSDLKNYDFAPADISIVKRLVEEGLDI